MQRYDGKPFLRLLECYVLWAAGELTPADDQKLQAMTPKLQEVYKQQGSWQEIIAAVMEFRADLPQHIDALWQENKQRCQSSGVELTAENFAQQFVDANFAEA